MSDTIETDAASEESLRAARGRVVDSLSTMFLGGVRHSDRDISLIALRRWEALRRLNATKLAEVESFEMPINSRHPDIELLIRRYLRLDCSEPLAAIAQNPGTACLQDAPVPNSAYVMPEVSKSIWRRRLIKHIRQFPGQKDFEGFKNEDLLNEFLEGKPDPNEAEIDLLSRLLGSQPSTVRLWVVLSLRIRRHIKGVSLFMELVSKAQADRVRKEHLKTLERASSRRTVPMDKKSNDAREDKRSTDLEKDKQSTDSEEDTQSTEEEEDEQDRKLDLQRKFVLRQLMTLNAQLSHNPPQTEADPVAEDTDYESDPTGYVDPP